MRRLPFAELVNVKKVLFSARSFLHANEVLEANHPHSHSPGICLTGSRPHLVVINRPRNVIKKIEWSGIGVHSEGRTVGKDLRIGGVEAQLVRINATESSVEL